MNSIKVLALCALVGLGVATTAQAAASYSVLVKVNSALDLGFNALTEGVDYTVSEAGPTLGTIDVVGPAGYYNIQLYLLVSGFTNPPERGFGAIEIDGVGTGDVTDSLFGWTANNPNVDTNGVLPPGATVPAFATNDGNGGVDGTGWNDILLSMARIVTPLPTDPRPTVGQAGGLAPLAGPLLIGDLYVAFGGVDGTYSPFINSTSYTLSPTPATGAYLINDSTGSTKAAGTVHIFTPEPTSIALLGLGGLGMIARRRMA